MVVGGENQKYGPGPELDNKYLELYRFIYIIFHFRIKVESWPKKSGIMFWTSLDVKLPCKHALLLQSHAAKNVLRKEVSDFFDEKDRDYDGCLSFGEFMGEETPLEKVFKNMDKDGDGTITKQVRWMVFFI